MNLSIIIDIIIVIAFVLIIVFSAKKGFVKSLLQFLSSVLSILFSIKLSELLSPYVYRLFEGKIVAYITANISKADSSLTLSQKALTAIEKFPKIFYKFADFFNMNLNNYSNYLFPSDYTEKGIAQEIADKMVYPVAIKILSILLSIVIFIILFVVLSLIAKAIAKLFKKLPLIGTVDKILGVLLGLAKCVVFVMILSAIIYIGINVIPFKSEKITSLLYDSKILSFSYQYNPLISLLKSR